MSQSTVKALRRDLRRTIGVEALDTLGETQANIARVANSVGLAHQRLDQLERGVYDPPRDVWVSPADQVTALRQFNEWGRLTDGQLAGIVQQVAGLAQEHTMLREAYIAHERACLTFLGRVRWLFRGRR